eukprot:TRINITY_DN10558_c0_g1_i2.p3 TRINITY_DN10558_c0_g1~~TRINITY_DN10558_c0_g1_i2.p3  ORF type:complete len:128 (+),score=27.52 TRINITY_DN10558_c0_g1_i2:707-1090(+)
MSRCTGIRAIVALEYDPKYYPNTSLPDVNHRANEVGHALRNEDWILAYDLGNELYFWELGAIRVSNNSTTTLHDLYPFDKHGKNSLSEYMTWLNQGFSSTFANVDPPLPVPARFQLAVDNVHSIYSS